MKTLLEVSNLTSDDIESIFNLTIQYFNNTNLNHNILTGKVIVNLFFESSTRTLSSFEIAEKSLGAHSITLNINTSSINKGESIIDTISNIDAMNPDLIIIRSQYSQFIKKISEYLPSCSIINAGDGHHEHPTQALTDYCTIRYIKKDINNLNISICGDILHSRVARSNIRLLSRYGANISLVAPPTLSCNLTGISHIYHNLIEGIRNADVIMLLRLQKERIINCVIPSEQEYSHLYMLNHEKLLHAKKDVIVMHPGPTNKGIEISNNVAEKNSVILLQVKMGVAARKAILHYLLYNKSI
ncbi:aspartate carbamoyltransferase [Ehrlichia chaffeensis str. Heartland]|uniref:Aspartate carbamoyltransferase catalytic subunit n=1 Tax=Ehrlichia chaffeensis (strain ATCC CRL-10679 / Arkansas) TaxID=205920 RepID=PYRB_EHRCR|nr:aspartate carbamoyltransferase catalytic subunit [Ehrlichia chaffeensis]Q2GGK2.1 RecName: Full=Aspartate carbamoyltransferase catalytic subunit; AltName: Full=Aspartate transcarbamylase; Short=ATCase [Ehrlichia chaffeensis str. Arkansas]ABD45390.1 aspartate carbamoyltransferase [Ehrlichia chaffeensis str. Arkansas]AHX03702.1 aspartate carbamoyltransferase [Ehrlichia chaffeensis str. Heartland]AHX05577.1 aspartate carbamoyltransferase [Ehrlichia chaffeensis str. Jax]AHX06567.1 aspartate carb